MRRTALASTALRSVGYDQATRTLEVEFQTGEIYQYFPVPREVYEQLLLAPSKGTYFEKHVKLKYMYRSAETP